jgi:hypothetical protein
VDVNAPAREVIVESMTDHPLLERKGECDRVVPQQVHPTHTGSTARPTGHNLRQCAIARAPHHPSTLCQVAYSCTDCHLVPQHRPLLWRFRAFACAGVNLPGLTIDLPSVTEKDRIDIATAVRLGADILFASFVQSADMVRQSPHASIFTPLPAGTSSLPCSAVGSQVRDIRSIAGAGVQIISKIENQAGERVAGCCGWHTSTAYECGH